MISAHIETSQSASQLSVEWKNGSNVNEKSYAAFPSGIVCAIAAKTRLLCIFLVAQLHEEMVNTILKIRENN